MRLLQLLQRIWRRRCPATPRDQMLPISRYILFKFNKFRLKIQLELGYFELESSLRFHP